MSVSNVTTLVLAIIACVVLPDIFRFLFAYFSAKEREEYEQDMSVEDVMRLIK